MRVEGLVALRHQVEGQANHVLPTLGACVAAFGGGLSMGLVLAFQISVPSSRHHAALTLVYLAGFAIAFAGAWFSCYKYQKGKEKPAERAA